MVLYLYRYDIHPLKAEAYNEWTKSALPRTLAIPGLVEFRAYRPVAGTCQVVLTYEFADLAAWAAWRAHEDNQPLMDELYTYATNVSTEVWGASPVVPEPIQPGG